MNKEDSLKQNQTLRYLDELIENAIEKDVKEEQKAKQHKHQDEPSEQVDSNEIYSVYILQRVVNETKRVCKIAEPNEALGVLLGYKCQYFGKTYVKVVDWATGRAYQSHAYAEFTPEGVRQYTTLIEEKYGESENRPRIVGIFHSHPFGSNPHFSHIDYTTFLNFPYDAPYNVFVLIDPKSNYYKAYIVVNNECEGKDLKEVDWVEYTPK